MKHSIDHGRILIYYSNKLSLQSIQYIDESIYFDYAKCIVLKQTSNKFHFLKIEIKLITWHDYVSIVEDVFNYSYILFINRNQAHF
jgi:hypothetical protein